MDKSLVSCFLLDHGVEGDKGCKCWKSGDRGLSTPYPRGAQYSTKFRSKCPGSPLHPPKLGVSPICRTVVVRFLIGFGIC